ncbi:MAG: tetratricopeptide repeat protein [Myxococcales bacterium]|nr:tetratricopeptide repeat protein [Myxococcales bacterium]
MARLGWMVLAGGLVAGAAVAAPAVPTPAKLAARKAALRKQTSGADAPMTVAARAKWRAGLKAGREAHRAKDYTAAVAGFDRALAAFPDDPRALMERGWARFQAGDLAGAGADTKAALGRSTDQRLRGAAFYNLGRVFEAQGEKQAATQAYKLSLEARPNKVVRARLAELGGKAPEPLAATPLLGPFADEAALCAALRTEAHLGKGLRCKAGRVETPLDAVAEGKAYIVAGGIPMFGDDEAPPPGPAWTDDVEALGEVVYHLVVPTPAGLYVRPSIAGTYNPGAFGISEELSFTQARAVAVPGASVAWWIDVSTQRSDSDMGINEVEFWTTSAFALCGVGASGVPSCVGPLNRSVEGSRELLIEDEPRDPELGPPDTWSKSAIMAVELSATGVLSLKVVKGKDMEPGLKALAGKHQVQFP